MEQEKKKGPIGKLLYMKLNQIWSSLVTIFIHSVWSEGSLM